MSNCNKTSNRCQTKNFAACTEYQGNLSNNTSIQDECYNLEEVVEDVISLVDNIFTSTDLSDLENCESLPTDRKVKTVIQYLLEQNCFLKDSLTGIGLQINNMQQQINDLQTNNCP